MLLGERESSYINSDDAILVPVVFPLRKPIFLVAMQPTMTLRKQ